MWTYLFLPRIITLTDMVEKSGEILKYRDSSFLDF